MRLHGHRDYVKKIAVYKDKLAVQLSSKVVIYELANPDDPFDMHYQSATKIQQKLDCNLLVVTSTCVILCQVCLLRFRFLCVVG